MKKKFYRNNPRQFPIIQRILFYRDFVIPDINSNKLPSKICKNEGKEFVPNGKY